MNPFDRYNPAKPHQVIFASWDKAAVEKVGQFLRLAGYHPHFNFSPTRSQRFEEGDTFQVLVPVEEMQAAREVLASYERD